MVMAPGTAGGPGAFFCNSCLHRRNGLAGLIWTPATFRPECSWASRPKMKLGSKAARLWRRSRTSNYWIRSCRPSSFSIVFSTNEECGCFAVGICAPAALVRVRG